MQELFNITLAREINGHKLDDRVSIICACNPSATFQEFSDSTYQVNEFDPAQASRFLWIFVDADINMWLDYATNTDPKTGKQRVHEDIVEYIASHGEFLNQPLGTDDVKANPRAWESVSQVYTAIKESPSANDNKLIYNVLRGAIGPTATTSFTQFIADNKNPIIQPVEFFESEEGKKGKVAPELIDRLKGESFPRTKVTVNKCIQYLTVEDKKVNAKEVAVMAEIVSSLKRDIMISIMSHIVNEFPKLHDKLADNEKYLYAFVDVDRLV